MLLKTANPQGVAERELGETLPGVCVALCERSEVQAQSGYTSADTIVLIRHLSCSRLRKNPNHSFKNSEPFVGYAII